MSYEIPPGMMPMVLLRPEQYIRMNAGIRYPRYFVYAAASRILHNVQDMFIKGMQAADVEAIRDKIPDLLSDDFGLAAKCREAGDEGDVTAVRETVERVYKGLFDNWVSGIWKGCGSAYMAGMEQFLGTGQLLYAYKQLMYRIAVTPRLTRYWNKVYKPAAPDLYTIFQMWHRGIANRLDIQKYGYYDGWSDAWIAKLQELTMQIPNPRTAFRMYARGALTREDFNKYIRQNAWGPQWNDKLFDIYKWLPTAHEAFYMRMKGIIDKAQEETLFHAQGFEPEWYDKLRQNWYYTPTLYDLTRMADYVELDLPWALGALRKRGIVGKDAALISQYLQLRPLRDEWKDIIEIWIRRYRLGRCIMAEFETALTDLGVKATEMTLRKNQAELEYQDELIDEQVDILTWYFKTAIITEEAFLEGLKDLGIRAEKANLMVEAEKARGYYGYY